jgi:hypothetical protein
MNGLMNKHVIIALLLAKCMDSTQAIRLSSHFEDEDVLTYSNLVSDGLNINVLEEDALKE